VSEIKTPPKRLVDFNPEWMSDRNDPTSEKWGIAFDCPCGTVCQFGPRLFIPFDNPVAGPVSRWGREKWHRTGETFEALTLSPSLHAEGHWHGWLRDGVLVSC
jgi:hypothetical protein